MLAGVAVGTVAVLLLLVAAPPGFAFALGLPRSGSVPSLDCGAAECVNISVAFRSLVSLEPSVLRLSITPVNGSVTINGTAGRPLNLTFVNGSSPHWVSDLGSGPSPTPFAGEIVNPSGALVGAGATSILSGATLCLKGTLGTTEEFRLTVAYRGASADLLFAVD